MKFNRYSGNPVIPRKKETFHSIHAANPDILERGDKVFMYFRGQGDELHDQMGVGWIDKENFNGVDWNFHLDNPIIKVSEDKKQFDSRHILDPATIIIDGKVYLYYSGHSYDRPACIGLAISEDGFSFEKYRSNPVIESAIAPEIIERDGEFFLFYQKKNKKGYFEFYCSKSTDGKEFTDEKCIFGPDVSGNGFDSFSVSTCRIWQEEDVYHMIYGGSDQFDDYPSAFGMASSRDLINWERAADNPIFERGEAGTWDEGGIWFGTVYKHGGELYMWYEGCGSGMGSNTEESRICRNEDYGGYARFNFSQIGLAISKTE